MTLNPTPDLAALLPSLFVALVVVGCALGVTLVARIGGWLK